MIHIKPFHKAHEHLMLRSPFSGEGLVKLLECAHDDKPSIIFWQGESWLEIDRQGKEGYSGEEEKTTRARRGRRGWHSTR